MTTSDGGHGPRRAFVWVWLPGATSPVVAGVLVPENGVVTFTYGRSYLDRDEAIPLYEPELPLRRGRIEPMAAHGRSRRPHVPAGVGV